MLSRLSRHNWAEPPPELRPTVDSFNERGLVALEGFFSEETCDGVVAAAEGFLEEKGVSTTEPSRIMNLYRRSPEAERVLQDPRLLETLGYLLGDRAKLLQSIYFSRGSEQGAHYDYMFMSTDPPQQLCGIWIACEDITDDAGPLMYYPGSHRIDLGGINGRLEERAPRLEAEIDRRLPELEHLYKARTEIAGQSILNCMFYDEWQAELAQELADSGIEMERALPRKGDLIVWHAGLVHGGTPVTGGPDRTRKSLVAHFLTQSVERYYDMYYVDTRKPLTFKDLKRINRDEPALVIR